MSAGPTMELIDREAALNCAEYDEQYRLVIPIDKIKNLTTIEAVPAVHGRWKFDDFDGDGIDYQCSICGGYSRSGHKFCPSCGARMDGGEALQ